MGHPQHNMPLGSAVLESDQLAQVGVACHVLPCRYQCLHGWVSVPAISWQTIYSPRLYLDEYLTNDAMHPFEFCAESGVDN